MSIRSFFFSYLFQAIISCEEVLNKQEKATKEPTPAVTKSVREKLPKLEVKTFNGKVYELQEF